MSQPHTIQASKVLVLTLCFYSLPFVVVVVDAERERERERGGLVPFSPRGICATD